MTEMMINTAPATDRPPLTATTGVGATTAHAIRGSWPGIAEGLKVKQDDVGSAVGEPVPQADVSRHVGPVADPDERRQR